MEIIVSTIFISSALIGGFIGALIGYKVMYKTWKKDVDSFRNSFKAGWENEDDEHWESF